MELIQAESIEEAWKRVRDLVLANGQKVFDEGRELSEVLNISIQIASPLAENEININQNTKMKSWMEDNFSKIKKIKELDNSWSYGWRLYNFQGTDQIEWVINKLKAKPESKSATITMLQKAGAEPYVPCVSLLDFKIRNNSLYVIATCRSLDIGQKALYNFYSLRQVAEKVMKALNLTQMIFHIHINSAHIYLDTLS
ncbi:MAG: hypothetical protein GF383_01355 [Candidatus Lokiarchaeota archaeon]|nr:hypothetical protein [Candidatus Lokiarchaeota archaeon]MBD3337913.1 hypothetical protein [Candidatus Lokiarchaeota archaeon]